VVLLVNGETRSGKEILAYGFKKYGIGPVVGERTAGAVVAGSAFFLGDGNLLYLAVADVDVDGERLEGRGVEPDVAVPMPLERAAGVDVQQQKALAVLQELIAKRRATS
jgi:carboxyl-terminal processing protease